MADDECSGACALPRYGLGRARAGTRLPHGKQVSRPVITWGPADGQCTQSQGLKSCHQQSCTLCIPQAKSLVCGPASDDTKQTVRAEETAALSGSMEALSITQLKRLIESRGASHADCLERSDLEARALHACQPAAE